MEVGERWGVTVTVLDLQGEAASEAASEEIKPLQLGFLTADNVCTICNRCKPVRLLLSHISAPAELDWTKVAVVMDFTEGFEVHQRTF